MEVYPSTRLKIIHWVLKQLNTVRDNSTEPPVLFLQIPKHPKRAVSTPFCPFGLQAKVGLNPRHPHSTILISLGIETSCPVKEKSCLCNVVQMDSDETRYCFAYDKLFSVTYISQNFSDPQENSHRNYEAFQTELKDLRLGFEFWKELGREDWRSSYRFKDVALNVLFFHCLFQARHLT